MRRLFQIGITGRLLLLVLIAVLPALAIQSYNEYDLRRSRVDDTRQRVVQITKQFGEEMGELREGARQLLVALSQFPALKDGNRPDCDAYMRTLKASYPNYLVLAAVNTQGETICSSSSGAQEQVAPLPFFKMAMAREGLVLGDYWKDPHSNAQALHFAMRFHEPDGKVGGVVYVAMDLHWLSELLKDRGLPAGGSILIADRVGNIIARLPHPEALVGKNMRRTHEGIMDGDVAGWEEARGVDGITRIFGYVPPALPPYDLFLSAGLSKADALVDIVRATHRGIALIVAGLLVAMAAAWFGGRYFIRRPIADLLRVTSDWRVGNTNARAQTWDQGSEIGRLASAFNVMADAVANRQAAQKQAEQQLMALASTLEERVEKRTEELAKANRVKSQFLANMSHEIRTPMNGVLGMLELLLETELSPQQRRYAQTALRSGESLLGIVNGVLDLSKIESGKLQLFNEPFDLHNTVEETLELFASSARSKNLNLACLISEGLPQHVIGDAGRLRQILTNLIGNAIKFTEKGEVVVYVGSVGAATDPIEVEFKVRDTGIGIAEEKQQEIFNPFSQADGSSSRRYGGTGLGLSIARQLCELMGGRINVESTPGVGTVFRFTIRLQVALIDEQAPTTEAQPLAGLSALVVDDSATNLEILNSQLRRMQVRAELASSADGAMEALRKRALQGQHFDFVLIDRALGTADGGELAREMRARYALLQTYLVILSSHEAVDDSEMSGLDGWLTKPVRQLELQHCLASLRTRTRVDDKPEGKPAAPPAPPSFTGTSVLLVEDNRINMEVARWTLLREGCDITTATNGKEAVDLVKERRFDIVFMDCQMPEMDGFEATRAIRALPAEQQRRTPIVALTANAVEGDREICLRAGMDDYLAKPVSRASLQATLNRWCKQPVRPQPPALAAGGAADKAADELSADALLRLRELEGPGSSDLVQTIMSRFLQDSAELGGRLAEAAQNRDAYALRLASHTLKSTSAIIGATALSESCARLERAAREGRTEEAGQLVDDAIALLERIKPVVQRHLDANPAQGVAELTV